MKQTTERALLSRGITSPRQSVMHADSNKLTPTEIARFRAIYDGFRCGGLVVKLDSRTCSPIAPGGSMLKGTIVHRSSGAKAGEVLRFLVRRDERLFVEHANLEIA